MDRTLSCARTNSFFRYHDRITCAMRYFEQHVELPVSLRLFAKRCGVSQLIDNLATLIKHNRANITGPIRQELLSGGRDAKHFSVLKDKLRLFLGRLYGFKINRAKLFRLGGIGMGYAHQMHKNSRGLNGVLVRNFI